MDEKKKLSDYISRDMYKQVKSMNREKMCDFLYHLYNEIYNDYEEQMKPDYEKIRSEILKINGIGQVKADAVIKVLQCCLENKEGDS